MAKRKRSKRSKWDLYEDGISYSALSKWINDRERFRIRAVEGLTEAGHSDALEFGNIFHNLLEWYSEGIKSATGLKRRLNAYLRKINADSNTKLLAAMAERIFALYLEHWEDGSKVYIEQEEKFRVPFRISTGRTIPLIGMRDAAFRDGGLLYLQENKTKGRIDHEWLTSALPYNQQTMMYCYSLFCDYGEKPAGVLYNVVRRPGLRQRQKEGDSAFLKRIEDDIKERPEHYFVRYQVDFGPHDLDNYVSRVLTPLLENLALWWESIKHDPFEPWTLQDGSVNPHHYLRPFGVYDAMAQGKGEYFDYVTRGTSVGLVEVDTLFPELSEESESDS